MQVVHKNDGTIPVEDILCTTYQMRNFYRQLGDGFFSNLDIMNYIQHLYAVRFAKKGERVLDVCCGRGLVLPLFRYHQKEIAEYIGVDIKASNMIWTKQDVRTNKPVDIRTFYPFKVTPIVSNVSEMSKHITDKVDYAIYTSSIEHMHKDHGEQSITELSKVLKVGGRLLLSCPNTPEGQDGYTVRYAAHVYEWKISELREVLQVNGFEVMEVIGLIGGKKDIVNRLKEMPSNMRKFFERLSDYLPTEFFAPFIYPALPPQLATEVMIIAELRTSPTVKG